MSELNVYVVDVDNLVIIPYPKNKIVYTNRKQIFDLPNSYGEIVSFETIEEAEECLQECVDIEIESLEEEIKNLKKRRIENGKMF